MVQPNPGARSRAPAIRRGGVAARVRDGALAWLLLFAAPAQATDYTGVASLLLTPVFVLVALVLWWLSSSRRPRKGVLVAVLVLALPLGFVGAIGVVDSLSLLGSGETAQALVYLVAAGAAFAGLVRLVYRQMRAEDERRSSGGAVATPGPVRPPWPVGDWVDEGKVWLELAVGEDAGGSGLAARVGEVLAQAGLAEGAAEGRTPETLDPLAPPGPPRMRIEFHLHAGLERRRLVALLRAAGAPGEAQLTFTDSMRLCGVRLDEP